MRFRIEDFTDDKYWYFPLQFDLMREMYVCYDHDVALTAILFGCQWFEDNESQIDIEQAAKVISARRGITVKDAEEQLEIAFKRVVKTVLPLAKKKDISKKRREAVNRRWERQRNGGCPEHLQLYKTPYKTDTNAIQTPYKGLYKNMAGKHSTTSGYRDCENTKPIQMPYLIKNKK